MKPLSVLLIACGLSVLASHAAAQPPLPPEPREVVHFSASAEAQAVPEQLTLTLSSSREGADAAQVQRQLRASLEAALAVARASAEPGAMEVRTGSFSLQPRHDLDGRISTWQGTAELVLEGRDFERIGATVGRIQGLTVANVAYGLSRPQREALEARAQTQAIERFRTRAGEIARAFGFAGYALREVHVNSQEQGVPPRQRLLATSVRSAAAEAPLPLEAGRATVQVTVSGAVQLR